jgi:hypothetical protein
LVKKLGGHRSLRIFYGFPPLITGEVLLLILKEVLSGGGVVWVAIID